MTDFPIKFEVYASSEEGVHTTWKSQVNALEPIETCIPPEFQGPGKGYTPEDFLGLAILNCIIALFKISCQKQQLKFKKIEGKAVLRLDKLQTPPFVVIGETDIFVNIIGASDEEKIKELFENLLKDCPVMNNLKSGKTFDLKFSK